MIRWPAGLWDLRRVLLRGALLVAVSALCAALAVDWTQAPALLLAPGDVAPRTVTAPFDFRYQDLDERGRRQAEARGSVAPVFVHDAALLPRLLADVDAAFEAGRGALPPRGEEGAAPALTEDQVDAASTTFRDHLGAHLPDEAVDPLARAAFPEGAARLARELLVGAMDGFVIGDRGALPADLRGFRLIERRAEGTTERDATGVEAVYTPSEARQRVTLGLIDSRVDAPWAEAAATVARALVQANLAPDEAETARRREAAASAVPVRTITVRRGTTLFRQGDPITALHVRQLTELQKTRTSGRRWVHFLTMATFLGLLSFSMVSLGRTTVKGFSTRLRDLAAAGALLVVIAFAARVVDSLGPPAATMLGAGAAAADLGWMVPVAGGVMMVRLLIGVRWAMVFGAVAAVTAALTLGGGGLEVGFFLVSGAVAAGSVDHTRERMAVVRAGLVTGLANAAAAFLLFFLARALVHGPAADPPLGPVLGMLGGFAGGLLSAFLVLALMPLFEAFGFVTDYRLMELASLNHPLLRQLMLRAPGSYHHSVVVGSLAEAACEAIGANALLARVASYFHDIGKSLQPQFFVENQGSGGNRHDRLDPYTSAEVIVAHVVEGGRLAREHGLPKPIVDNIYMHHGTGLLPYFYRKAVDEAGDAAKVDAARFRYPGPMPSTREAGVIMLADKVEAATRTIRQPTEEAFRAMIGRIVDSVMADGQFEACPLTFAEIRQVTDSFVKTLMGIYHHRIEYPDTASISQQGAPISAVIPLDRARRAAAAAVDEDETDPNTDYESVEHLPRSPNR